MEQRIESRVSKIILQKE